VPCSADVHCPACGISKGSSPGRHRSALGAVTASGRRLCLRGHQARGGFLRVGGISVVRPGRSWRAAAQDQSSRHVRWWQLRHFKDRNRRPVFTIMGLSKGSTTKSGVAPIFSAAEASKECCRVADLYAERCGNTTMTSRCRECPVGDCSRTTGCITITQRESSALA